MTRNVRLNFKDSFTHVHVYKQEGNFSMDTDRLITFLNQAEAATKKPEKYLSLQEEKAEEIKILTKDLYDFCKKKENPKYTAPETLTQLVIADLDEEQIWQQVEIQNNSICSNLVSDIALLLAKKDKLKFPLKGNQKKLPEEVKEINKEEGKNNKNEKNKAEEENKKILQKKRKAVKSSIVDDKFFRLHEMETFLEEMEKEEGDDEDVDYGDDEEDVDYFEESSDDNENQLLYNDFFDQPDDDEFCNKKKREGFDMESEEKRKEKKVKFALEDEESDVDNEEEEESGNEEEERDKVGEESGNEEEEEGDEVGEESYEGEELDENFEEEFDDIGNIEDNEEDDEEQGNEVKKKKDSAKQPSTFEARQERLKSRINALEDEALSEKPWQMKGEVTGKNRPQNSLLQEYVEFDIATRPAPVLTEKSTLKLEDVIIQRIKDKAWDDVVRKFKPIANELDYKKKLVLDQEKSKLSLAQIYEQEYLKQLDGKNEDLQDKPEVEPPEHQEIRIMMNKLFSKLDALSNFHFTPKQIEPEIKIISNLPAIAMEEVAPVTTSDAALLAPEEVKAKQKGELMGKSERTATDKKRERRKKKIKQKLKYKQIEAKAKLQLEKQDSKGLRSNKLSEKLLQKITKSSNITQLEESKGEKYIRSSNKFFSKLQDDTSSKIKKKGFELKSQKLGKKSISKKPKTK